jgi:LysM repeat protein
MKYLISYLFVCFIFITVHGQSNYNDCESARIKELLDISETKLGCIYDWGANGPSRFDCSGFTHYVFKNIGIDLPRVAGDQYNSGKIVTITNIRKGDLVFFISREKDIEIGHVGLAVSDYSNGDFQFIHSCYSIGVCISNYKNNLYLNSFVGARRIIRCDDKLNNIKAFDTLRKPVEFSKQDQASDTQQKEIKRALQEFPNDYFYYTVKKGEKLLDISRKYSVSVENLMKWNYLKSNILYGKRQLKIYLSADGF